MHVFIAMLSWSHLLCLRGPEVRRSGVVVLEQRPASKTPEPHLPGLQATKERDPGRGTWPAL